MSDEGSEEYGIESYNTLFKQLMTDLGISRIVEQFKIMVEPEEPYFLISMKLGKARNAIKVPEVAHLDENPRGTMLTITDESYAPALLTLLWSKYGRDRIEQLTRFETLVKGVGSDELSALEVDPGEELRRKVLDAVWRLFPEGFKVRHTIVSDKAMTVIGTEHDMKDEWIKVAEDEQKKMEAA